MAAASPSIPSAGPRPRRRRRSAPPRAASARRRLLEHRQHAAQVLRREPARDANAPAARELDLRSAPDPRSPVGSPPAGPDGSAASPAADSPSGRVAGAQRRGAGRTPRAARRCSARLRPEPVPPPPANTVAPPPAGHPPAFPSAPPSSPVFGHGEHGPRRGAAKTWEERTVTLERILRDGWARADEPSEPSACPRSVPFPVGGRPRRWRVRTGLGVTRRRDVGAEPPRGRTARSGRLRRRRWTVPTGMSGAGWRSVAIAIGPHGAADDAPVSDDGDDMDPRTAPAGCRARAAGRG